MENKIRYRELGGINASGFFSRKHIVPIDESYADSVMKYAEKRGGIDIYHSIWSYDSPDQEEGNIIGPLYFDFDTDLSCDSAVWKVQVDTLLAIGWLEKHLKIPSDDIQVFFSGSKGYHVTVQPEVLGIEPSPDLNEDYRALALVLHHFVPHKTLDIKIYDRKRLWRFPNTINRKTGCFKIPVTKEEIRGVSLEYMLNLAQEQREISPAKKNSCPAAVEKWREFLAWKKNPLFMEPEKPKRKFVPLEKTKELLPCVTQALENGTKQGSRNNTSVVLASSLCQAGYQQEDAMALLLSWNQQNDPPLAEAEVMATVRSAYTMGADGKGYGCRSYREANMCVGTNCEMYRGEL